VLDISVKQQVPEGGGSGGGVQQQLPTFKLHYKSDKLVYILRLLNWQHRTILR
jgi:hypothetical protein